jgi:two-component system, NtrC family, sensor kinase
MHAAPRNPVADRLVQLYRACLESGHAPGSSGDLSALLQDVAQHLHNVVSCDAMSLVLHDCGRHVMALAQATAALEQRVEERTTALRHAIGECQRLEQAARRAEHLALMGLLAAGMTHEIRNPLAAVCLHVDVLEEELRTPSPDGPAVVVEALAAMKTNLARLSDLAQNYLTLARVPGLRREVQDLGRAVQAWGTEMQPEMASRSIALQMQGLAGLGLVAFHANTLRRALLNLVQNAADAMPQGGTVTLTGQGTATQVQLCVQDTGSGIPAEHLGQIFEPLYTTKPAGTGLGLAIVREIVAAHEGQITVESVAGQGTTFTLTLPRTPSGAPPLTRPMGGSVCHA